jgi:hypothetical protein
MIVLGALIIFTIGVVVGKLTSSKAVSDDSYEIGYMMGKQEAEQLKGGAE